MTTTTGGAAVPDADVRRIAPDPMPTLVVSEVFGPTVQGEGPSTGQRAAFVRLGGCNLHCSWCDTPYTWDASRFDLREQMARRSVADIAHDLAGMDPALVVITGGEPLMQQGQAGFESLVTLLGRRGVRVEIETNGTIAPAPWIRGDADHVTFNVSPKLAHAGDPYERRIIPDALRAFVELTYVNRAVFKFVVTVDDLALDLAEIAGIREQAGIVDDDVWIMPEGRTAADVLAATAAVAEPVIAEGYNLSTRLHVLIWNDERGR